MLPTPRTVRGRLALITRVVALLAVLAATAHVVAPGVSPASAKPGKARSSVTISLSGTSLRVNDSLVVTGTVRPFRNTPRRTVFLQSRSGDTWQTVAKRRAKASGKYFLKIPAQSAGRFTLRVKAAGTQGTRPATSPAREITVLRQVTRVRATWPARAKTPGQEASVRGVVEAGKSRTVLLQRKVPGGWATDRSVRLTGESFRIGISTRYLGDTALRIVVPMTRARTAAAVDKNGAFTVRPGWNAAGSSKDFAFLPPRPFARWNPCQPIGYRVNARQANAGALGDVRTALARVTVATGIPFVYRGTSRKIPQRNTQDFGPRTELLIAWAKTTQTNIFTRNDRAVGRGGAFSFTSGFVDGAGRPVNKAVLGRVVLNTRYEGSLVKPGAGQGPTRVALIMHEVAHVMGLNHAGAKAQIMFPQMTNRVDLFGKGDVAGLKRLGWTQGCIVRDRGFGAATADGGFTTTANLPMVNHVD